MKSKKGQILICKQKSLMLMLNTKIFLSFEFFMIYSSSSRNAVNPQNGTDNGADYEVLKICCRVLYPKLKKSFPLQSKAILSPIQTQTD